MSRYAVLVDGDVKPNKRLSNLIAGAHIIAADGGIRHAIRLGLDVDCWVGDFDSTDESLKQAFSHVPQYHYPVDKDQSDGELAVDYALQQGATEIVIIGAFGGKRADLALWHILYALKLQRQNIKIILTSGDQEGHIIVPGQYQFDFLPTTLISLIGLSDLEGLSLSGVKWPLENRDVEVGSSLTLSNRVTGTLSLALRSGYGLLIANWGDRDPSGNL